MRILAGLALLVVSVFTFVVASPLSAHATSSATAQAPLEVWCC